MDNRQLKALAIAKVCHQAMKANLEVAGNYTIKSWEHCEQWERDFITSEVKCAIDNPSTYDAQNHDNWVFKMKNKGWKYGDVEDPVNMIHPHITNYINLQGFNRRCYNMLYAIIESLSRD